MKVETDGFGRRFMVQLGGLDPNVEAEDVAEALMDLLADLGDGLYGSVDAVEVVIPDERKLSGPRHLLARHAGRR